MDGDAPVDEWVVQQQQRAWNGPCRPAAVTKGETTTEVWCWYQGQQTGHLGGGGRCESVTTAVFDVMWGFTAVGARL